MKGPREHTGSRHQVVEHRKSLAGDQQVVVSPSFCFSPLKVAIPVFLPLSKCHLVVTRLYSGMIQKLASDK